ncbi:unnamed protein product [Schistocephalus solidus]|uniref:Rho-GAP domain-containing protein n=1 Tax=Schistocephalus solidus TaxID=70667 RepID=A0A183SSP0_SCHSO|nr:unnamed protein product [Schistocephalus solidus]
MFFLYALLQAQMLQRAANLAAGEHTEEAWFLVSLFQRTQPREMLQICHNILASFLELNYEYFNEGWPLNTRLHAADDRTIQSVGSVPRCSRLLRRRSGGRARSRSPNTTSGNKPFARPKCNWLDTESAEAVAGENEQERERADSCLTMPSLRPESERSILTTPKRQPRLGWLRGRATQGCCGPDLLPSKPLLSTPGSNVASPAHPSIEQILRIVRSPAHVLSRPRRKSKENDFFWEDSTHPTYSSPRENSDAALCRYIIDFMLSNPELTEVEGLFRRPGSITRTKALYAQLKECILTGYMGVCQPAPNFLPENEWDDADECDDCQSQMSRRRRDAYSLLAATPIYDLTSVLLRCLASSTSRHPAGGLIPPEATDLFVQTTQLQYRLVDRRPVYKLRCYEDWIHLLCHGRQLLAYRIIVQLLLPPPERQLLLRLLSLLHRIAANGEKSKMHAESLARCLALAVFGSPQATLKWSQSENASTQMSWYIDTLVNLIELYEELEVLPALVYQEVRANLRSKLGHSPLRPVNEQSHRADGAVLRRSWATCKLSCNFADKDRKAASQQFEAAIPQLADQQMRTKDNRSFLLTHLCGWSRSPDGEVIALPPLLESAKDADKATAQGSEPSSREGTRKIPSPFIVWRKKRNAAKVKRLIDGVLTKEESSAPLTRTEPMDPLSGM